MAGLAGLARAGERALVERMLDKMAHRGSAGRQVVEFENATLGLAWPAAQPDLAEALEGERAARDQVLGTRLAEARATPQGLVLRRDRLGVAPLYYGHDAAGALCLASEVKALLRVTRDVQELSPGHVYDGTGLTSYAPLVQPSPLTATPAQIARELRRRLAAAVAARLQDGPVGGWLSGGLDSSALAALARPHVQHLHTFAAGLPGAPDLEYARMVADFVGTAHHEVVVRPRDLLAALPETIYYLGSFDALLVRSSITNYLVAGKAAEYVPAVLSGEGGDELFAGYGYLKALDPAALSTELLDITGRLHNTALQRVDRCAAAHGLVAYVPFLDPQVVDYALRIPVGLKLRDGVEKWILRQALAGLLPERVLYRPKAKFWAGAGIGEILSDYAETLFTDQAFRRGRKLPNGWVLNSKEELLYNGFFRERFGELENLSWMGRTKRAPRGAL